MKFKEAERFLLLQRRREWKLGLQSMAAAMELLGRPHESLPAVLVAGSKGKGSFCAFLEAILLAAGYRAGLYTSPHLLNIRERIRVGGRPIGPSAFTRHVEQMRGPLRAGRCSLTYFEWLTAMAIKHFAERQVPLAIMEVGLGGRLDATNIVPAGIAVVTGIEKEHTEYLGPTLREIAGEKGGVIKDGSVFLSGVSSPSAARELARIAKGRRAVTLWLEREASWQVVGHSTRGLRMDLSVGRDEYRGLRLGLLGRHQARNAALAVMAAGELRARGFRIDNDHVRRGLGGVTWPGRCEYRPGRPPLLVDVAHTPSSTLALVETIDELFPRRPLFLLFGLLRDKNITGIASLLFPRCRHVVLVQPPEQRGSTPAEMLSRLPRRLRALCTSADSVENALSLVRKEAGSAGLVVVAGSLFLAGAVLGRLRSSTPGYS